jgi:hypothetical protein
MFSRCFWRNVSKFGEKCQEALKLSFVDKTVEEVAENWCYFVASGKEKSICTGQLTEMIQQLVRFKSVNNSHEWRAM